MAEGVQSQFLSYDSPPRMYDSVDPVSSRRVKPLPKRRRTTALPPPPQDITPKRDTDFRRSLPAELAKALPDSIGQGHYVPIFSGVPGLIGCDTDARHVGPPGFDRRANDESFADGHEDIDQGDGDYVDFIRRPSNTKKRKVPVTAHSRRDDGALDSLGSEEELADKLLSSLPDRTLIGQAEIFPPIWNLNSRKSKLSRAARAALQHKELLKNRKRQLAAVLGAITHGDTLALDQALSSSYSLPKPSKGPNGQALEGPTLRVSRRLARRKARTLAFSNAKTSSEVRDENAGLPECDFTFKYGSATSERLRATKDEVAVLHKRFEVELSQQAAKAAEAAQQAASAISQMRKSKRDGRSQQRARIGNGTDGGIASEPSTPNKLTANAKSKSKKTKRSALANASNPHHLRNYIPSRLPSGGSAHSGSTVANAQNHMGPFPLRFLSAELPSRNKKGSSTAPTLANLTNPEDEWICPFCEYDLFYGDEQSFRRAVRQRKKILARRRRAMERASAAAAGRKKNVAPSENTDSDPDELEDGYADVAQEEHANTVQNTTKPTKAKEQERDRDKDKGQAI